MKIKGTILLTLLCMLTAAAFADEPFRRHRYDALDALPITPNDIVFVGNSITNMHEWWEAFGCRHNIKNRGVSGALSTETLQHLRHVVKGKPRKIFLMIGTNDLNTKGMEDGRLITANISKMLQMIRSGSPKTQVYVQSILPSATGMRTPAKIAMLNKAIRTLCLEANATYIDLEGDLSGVPRMEHTLDGLHLTASGYRLWCHRIAPLVLDADTADTVYPPDTQSRQQTAGLDRSLGMRATYFSVLPVVEGDVLMIGDEMIHGGEWHELLDSPKVKNRGTGWGYPGCSMETIGRNVEVMFMRSCGKGPSAVCLYAGTDEALHGTSLDDMMRMYAHVIAGIKSKAPNATIRLMSLLPVPDAAVNVGRIRPFNEMLRALADKDSRLQYVDIYTPMERNGIASPEFFIDSYVNGKGYAVIAAKVAEALGM